MNVSSDQLHGRTYDSIVVGSGAAGAMSAFVLTKAGAKVLMIESGRHYDPQKETPMFQSYAEAPLRGVGTPEKPSDFFAANIGGWAVPGEPYIVQSLGKWSDGAAIYDKIGGPQNFMWWRSRMLGGRTNRWGRQTPRFGPLDFISRSRDGLGVDWPICYDDVAPYYNKVESLIGVFGSKAGLANNPDSDCFMPPPPPRVYERLLQKAGSSLDIPIIAARRAILTRPHNGRSACFYTTDCRRGCSIGAAFQTTTSLIPSAQATGNLDILTLAHVREITLGPDGRANGVLFIDKTNGKQYQANARTVVLGASACETGRILLNSRPPTSAHGLGNSSGHLGRWLMDSTGISVAGRIPSLENLPLHNEDGVSVAHLVAPWTPNRATAEVPRGYYISWSGGRAMPSFVVTDPLLKLVEPSAVGTRLKTDLRRFYGSLVTLEIRGEMIPNARSYCELDSDRKDQWGTPVLRFHFEWGDLELKQVLHAQQTCSDLLTAAGGKLLKPLPTDPRQIITTGGSVNHETGVTRMSAKPGDGVTNRWSQLWDCPNVIVADGGVLPSNPEKNPTLTIMALAWRACEHLAESLRRHDAT